MPHSDERAETQVTIALESANSPRLAYRDVQTECCGDSGRQISWDSSIDSSTSWTSRWERIPQH